MEDDIAPSQLVSSPTSPKEASVKSNAVVKYSLVETPVMYAPLSHNTNIKLPPRNWLSSAAASRGLHEPTVRSSGFSSFRMANMFPESVGEVDVVSDAENIKKLLKIPYSSKSVSMVVHRVENTLLIDEFDIHKHLLSRAENEWAWLRQYFIEHILSTLSSKDKALPYHAKSRTALQQRSLVSKFLHYSLAETDDNNSNKRNDTAKSDQSQTPLPLATKGPALPEPRIEQGIPCSNDDHQFTRNVLWTFEDIQMLLGTDLPIFGGPTRPCISLRLRDANQPISVLTGIDYWLDNLMSNVPEVVMCYHLDGIVQKYELIKTEDLPNLKESKFSPNLIRDVAQNILSFLKANATKAGHTYWLFKGTNEDAVKLYDLTSLCSDTMRDKEQNPFTIPVGMLLYRVARNMMATGLSPGQNNTIRTVLKNCISLLSKEKYPQIVTSAHFMLADVYIPDDTDPSSPDLLSQSEHELSSMDDEDDANSDESAPVTSLLLNQALAPSKPRNGKYDQPPIGKCGIEERCRNALNHICEGLKCLQYFESPSQKLVDKLIKKSEELLAYGIKMFESVGDTANTALLLSNSGRLHRLKCYAPIDENSRMTPHTKIYHTKAVDCYTSALQVLRSRKSAPAFWDLVYWELSTTLYTLATLNQDHPQLPGPNKTIEEIEREAAELLLKAIRYCDLASNSYRQPLYQFRAATLHQRLGSLYFNSFRTFDYNEGKAKQIVQLCQINYSKAISLFWLLDNPLQVVRVQLELLALYELVADELKSVNLKIKNLQKALSVCSDCKQAISSIIGKNSTKSTETCEYALTVR
ncbi:unnamed protein product [Nesidiocoris tenuis]|uniref:Erythroid differentiation-related factor 1 n=1 Tax=Nesidiocoris tenuis TaxID=355587 RepID=A0A6H5G6V4_9HEMI|nr:unnamed protein product [Nesidiocoris tenuis]